MGKVIPKIGVQSSIIMDGLFIKHFEVEYNLLDKIDVTKKILIISFFIVIIILPLKYDTR